MQDEVNQEMLRRVNVNTKKRFNLSIKVTSASPSLHTKRFI